MSDNFHNNFGSIWESFLSFEIDRSREALDILAMQITTLFFKQSLGTISIFFIKTKRKRNMKVSTKHGV